MKKIILESNQKKEVFDIRKRIGINLDNAIRAMGISQVQFAEMIGIKPNTLSYWVNGKRIETISALEKISKATGKPIEWFFQDESKGSELQKAVAKLQHEMAEVKAKYQK